MINFQNVSRGLGEDVIGDFNDFLIDNQSIGGFSFLKQATLRVIK
jgi:hypothetical protein